MKVGTFIKMVLMLLIMAATGIYFLKPELIQEYLPEGWVARKPAKKAKKKVVRKKKTKDAAVAVKETVPEEPAVVQKPEEVPAPEIADSEKAPEPPVPAVVAEDMGDVPMVIKNAGIVKGEEWADCAKVREKVAEELAGKLEKLSPA